MNNRINQSLGLVAASMIAALICALAITGPMNGAGFGIFDITAIISGVVSFALFISSIIATPLHMGAL